MLPQFAVLPCGSFFWRGSEIGNGAKAGLPVTYRNDMGFSSKFESRSKKSVKEAFGIVSLWFGLWRKIEGSGNRDSSVFARK